MRLWLASFVVLVSSVASAQTSPTYTQRGALERATTFRVDSAPPDRTLLDSGEVGEGYGLRLLRIDPYDERTHLSVVRALVGAHRHGEALRHYRHYTARMRELGIEPAGFPGRG